MKNRKFHRFSIQFSFVACMRACYACTIQKIAGSCKLKKKNEIKMCIACFENHSLAMRLPLFQWPSFSLHSSFYFFLFTCSFFFFFFLTCIFSVSYSYSLILQFTNIFFLSSILYWVSECICFFFILSFFFGFFFGLFFCMFIFIFQYSFVDCVLCSFRRMYCQYIRAPTGNTCEYPESQIPSILFCSVHTHRAHYSWSLGIFPCCSCYLMLLLVLLLCSFIIWYVSYNVLTESKR